MSILISAVNQTSSGLSRLSEAKISAGILTWRYELTWVDTVFTYVCTVSIVKCICTWSWIHERTISLTFFENGNADISSGHFENSRTERGSSLDIYCIFPIYLYSQHCEMHVHLKLNSWTYNFVDVSWEWQWRHLFRSFWKLKNRRDLL